MKIDDLNSKKAAKVAEMEKLVTGKEIMTTEDRTQYEALAKEVKEIDESIKIVNMQAELSKTLPTGSLRNEDDGERKEKMKFNTAKAINEMRSGKGLTGLEREVSDQVAKELKQNGINDLNPAAVYLPKEILFKANPMLTSTTSGITNSIVAPGVSIMRDDAYSHLTQLGVHIIPGVNGSIKFVKQAPVSSTFPGENTRDASFGVAPSLLTLTPARVGGTQKYSAEFLNQTNPDIAAGLNADFANSIWSAVASQLYDNFAIDAADASVHSTVAALSFSDILKLLKAKGTGNSGFVTTPDIMVYLMSKSRATTNIPVPIWTDNNTVVGRVAYANDFANANQMYYSKDWYQAKIAQTGGIELIYDPYSSKEFGLVEIAAHGFFDTGIANSTAFKWIDDASAGV